jgi:hypothetical protein
VSASGTIPTSAMLDQWSAEAFASINAYLGATGATKALCSLQGASFQSAAMVVSIQYDMMMVNAVRKLKRGAGDGEDANALDSVANYQLVPCLTPAQKAMLLQAVQADAGGRTQVYDLESGQAVPYGQPASDLFGGVW